MRGERAPLGDQTTGGVPTPGFTDGLPDPPESDAADIAILRDAATEMRRLAMPDLYTDRSDPWYGEEDIRDVADGQVHRAHAKHMAAWHPCTAQVVAKLLFYRAEQAERFPDFDDIEPELDIAKSFLGQRVEL